MDELIAAAQQQNVNPLVPMGLVIGGCIMLSGLRIKRSKVLQAVVILGGLALVVIAMVVAQSNTH